MSGNYQTAPRATFTGTIAIPPSIFAANTAALTLRCMGVGKNVTGNEQILTPLQTVAKIPCTGTSCKN
jgi:hypothetical protein